MKKKKVVTLVDLAESLRCVRETIHEEHRIEDNDEDEKDSSYYCEECYDLAHSFRDGDMRDFIRFLDYAREKEGKRLLLAISDTGTWRGRKLGYLFTEDFNKLLQNCNDSEIYLEGNDLKIINRHHDGTNYLDVYFVNTAYIYGKTQMDEKGVERRFAKILFKKGISNELDAFLKRFTTKVGTTYNRYLKGE